MEQVHPFEVPNSLNHVSLKKGEQTHGLGMVPSAFLSKVVCQAVRIRLMSAIAESNNTSGFFAREEDTRYSIQKSSVFIDAHNVGEVGNLPILFQLRQVVPIGVPYGKRYHAIRGDVAEVSMDNAGIFQRHISPVNAVAKRHLLGTPQRLCDAEHHSTNAMAISSGI